MIDQVRPSELTQWLQRIPHDGPGLLLDVREPWELQVASVQAAGWHTKRIPMGELAARIAELDPRQPIACLCHHGARSLRVANFLDGNGFVHVANVAGGIHAWSVECDASVPTY